MKLCTRFVCSILAAATLLSIGAAANADGAFAAPPPGFTVAPVVSPAIVSPPTEAVREAILVERELAARRRVNIERLVAYAKAGVFPRNAANDMPVPILRNVFVDARGVACAVANLMRKSGDQQLVAETARTNNYVRLGEVTSGALLDWILTSGLTQEEIAMIQAPYMPTRAVDAAQFERDERARLQAHFTVVERQLRAAAETSLTLAAARLPASLRASLSANTAYGSPAATQRVATR